MADATTKSLYARLPDFVRSYMGSIPIFRLNQAEELSALSTIKSLVPPTNTQSVTSIISAGWQIRIKLDEWKILEQVENVQSRRTQKIRVLRDLILKGLEVYEYDMRILKYAS